MAKGRGGRSSMGFGSRSRAPARTTSSAPAQRSSSSSSGGSMLGAAAGMIGQGMTFGMGSAIGHRVVGGVADAMTGGGGGEQAPVQQQQTAQYSTSAQSMEACGMEKGNYFDCLKSTSGDASACQPLMDMLKNCQAGGLQGNGEKQWS
mmetsp:Transcript_18730/g.38982  ORF Transcript_18730/g.38982 Transcript_18730/m.38982 type:complete len:148 (+) Transcript_18730:46-489(+)|eukprot:CAMPEP_0118644932 /NCGR_PEP_ID=MMETSP0785-20121206/7222_1 /TAXON_ID=91992 /ORGANISM="Bolidomonas pacifica, Strain CCMP 1866" /LENGTH=147 /DNA_ID=CAMNT_0006536763 /DNA_START=24 /DNA_END=467 /DNA_ORIENTATION=+